MFLLRACIITAGSVLAVGLAADDAAVAAELPTGEDESKGLACNVCKTVVGGLVKTSQAGCRPACVAACAHAGPFGLVVSAACIPICAAIGPQNICNKISKGDCEGKVCSKIKLCKTSDQEELPEVLAVDALVCDSCKSVVEGLVAGGSAACEPACGAIADKKAGIFAAAVKAACKPICAQLGPQQACKLISKSSCSKKVCSKLKLCKSEEKEASRDDDATVAVDLDAPNMTAMLENKDDPNGLVCDLCKKALQKAIDKGTAQCGTACRALHVPGPLCDIACDKAKNKCSSDTDCANKACALVKLCPKDGTEDEVVV